MYNIRIKIESTSLMVPTVLWEADIIERVITSRYEDGSESFMRSSYNNREVARFIGFTGDDDSLFWYAYEPDFCRHFVIGSLFDCKSWVIWNIAHNQNGYNEANLMEERIVCYFQRYLHGKIGPVDDFWIDMKGEALTLLLPDEG